MSTTPGAPMCASDLSRGQSGAWPPSRSGGAGWHWRLLPGAKPFRGRSALSSPGSLRYLAGDRRCERTAPPRLRDALYFSARLRTGRVIPDPTMFDTVSFGSRVTFSADAAAYAPPMICLVGGCIAPFSFRLRKSSSSLRCSMCDMFSRSRKFLPADCKIFGPA